MKLGASSDLARLQSLQRQAIAARSSLDNSGTEMTTGEKTSRFDAAGGNLTRLFSLERALERNSVYSDTIVLNEMRLEVAQQALGRVYTDVETISVNLKSSVGFGDMDAALIYAESSRRAFSETVSALNTRVAGRSLFAGTATSGAAMADAEAILADLDSLAAGETSAAGTIAAIEAYFERPGGGFYTTGYIGGANNLSSVETNEGVRIDVAVRADQEEIVSVLRGHALAAVIAGGAMSNSVDDQKSVLNAAAEHLLDGRDNMIFLRAQVGVSQDALESSRAELSSERSTFELARTRMVEADPVEAATRFKALESQLEAIYTVTARLSDLSFLNFMR